MIWGVFEEERTHVGDFAVLQWWFYLVFIRFKMFLTWRLRRALQAGVNRIRPTRMLLIPVMTVLTYLTNMFTGALFRTTESEYEEIKS